MIGHQAVGDNLNIKFFAVYFHYPYKCFIIFFVQKNIFLSVSSVVYMVDTVFFEFCFSHSLNFTGSRLNNYEIFVETRSGTGKSFYNLL